MKLQGQTGTQLSMLAIKSFFKKKTLWYNVNQCKRGFEEIMYLRQNISALHMHEFILDISCGCWDLDKLIILLFKNIVWPKQNSCVLRCEILIFVYPENSSSSLELILG